MPAILDRHRLDRVAMARSVKENWPTLVAVVVAGVYIIWRLASYNWDPVALAELGSVYQGQDKLGSEGYDGQFVYYIALNPNPDRVAQKLDVPAYRYQRILLPTLGRTLAVGKISFIPWTLVIVNLFFHALGTWSIGRMLVDRQLWVGYALIYGLWVGLVAGVGLQLTEPLAFGLIALGWFARLRRRPSVAACLLVLALFAKETSLLFWAAALLEDILSKKRDRSLIILIGGGLLFLGWQIWLWRMFGSPGLGSGGAMATSFEWVPFMGLWRIGPISLAVLGLYVVIFGPTIVLPTIWGMVRSLRSLWRHPSVSENWALLINGLLIVFLPFSTFREPLGLVRVATGLVLAVVLYTIKEGLRKPLNYGLFWISLLVILLNR